LASAGVAVDTVVEEELHPADGLLGAVDDHDGDLLVVGARGARGFVGLRAGGVAMKVLHRAGVPIVLIPES
jgi:nucleotide-binding universal stress UspA family protein